VFGYDPPLEAAKVVSERTALVSERPLTGREEGGAMPVEPGDSGSLVYGYLDTAAPHHARAGDTVVVSSPGTPYEAAIRPYRFGALSACEITGDQDVQVRRWRAPTADRLVVGVLLGGEARLEQNGRDTTAGPGEFLIYTGATPFRLAVHGPYRYFVVGFDGLPTTTAQNALRRMTSGELISHAPAARIFAATLAELADQAPRLDPAIGRELGEHVTCLLRTVLRAPAEPAEAPLHAQVMNYIEAHLGDDLRPETIAAAHHISVRYLHKLFQHQDGTLGEHVRRRRLDRIRRMLADPDLSHRPVATIAAQWGLAEASHFSKLFRAEYGVTPREFRRTVLG
jgi:AraC-like DNA-binding protein